MNKIKVNIVNILKNIPSGSPLYCTICGWIRFKYIDIDSEYPIVCTQYNDSSKYLYFTKYGYYINNKYAECVIFPSDTCRIWDDTSFGNFNKNTLKPFDKVLVRDNIADIWKISLFGHIVNNLYYCINEVSWHYCIPYNSHTKHLLGTDKEEPNFYKQFD